MKAAVYERYGPPSVLEVRDLPEPRRQPGYALVEVHAAALNPKDVLLRRGKMRWLGARLPHVPGYDFAGILLDDAAGLSAGTPVFGMIQSHRAGACAEVASLPYAQVARKPDALSMAEAAAVPLAALTALQGLRDDLGVRAGETVLLNGASGGVGTFAIQIAKAMGAKVVAVCSSANAELVTQLGADRMIDYRRTSPEVERGLDHIFDIYGTLPWRRARPCLRPGGRYCTTIPSLGSVARGVLARVGLHRAALVVVQSRRSDLDQLRGWIDAGELRPIVDRVVPLAGSTEGHERLETRRTRGKVVIEIRKQAD